MATRADVETTAAAPREELLARARALVPVLRERAAGAEEARCVPDETVAQFRSAGLIRLTQPARYGGSELGWDVLCEVCQILAAADGAQAWIQAIMADHAQMVGSFPAEAQEEVWGADPEAVMSASFEPNGVARPVEGGFRFSGRHGFASGIDHADWLICGGFIREGETRDGPSPRPPGRRAARPEDRLRGHGRAGGPHFFLIRKSEATVIDDWYTVGLEGTGSKSFSVEDVFIPAHRMLDGARARAGDPPGAEVNRAPVYRLPRGGLTPTVFAALTVGMARGVLEEWLTYTAGRTSRGAAVGDRPGSHMIAGEASAEIAAAEALYLGTIRDSMDRLAAGERMSETDIAIAKRNAAFACRLAIAAGTRLFNAAGGRAIFRGNALQRQYRNMMAGAAHFSVTWDTNAIAAGKALLERATDRP